MSLINDALRRAKESQQQVSPPAFAAPLKPVEPEPRSNAFIWLAPLFVILLIVAAIFFAGLAMAKRTVAQIVNAPEPAATQEVATAAEPVVARPPAIETNTPVSVSAAEPLPHVQGIVYSQNKPWAILNGQSVFVGDHVGDYRVQEISKYAVTLAGANGKTQTIHLGN